VLTVYDMVAESHFPICIRELREAIATKYSALERATLLPCISESTAKELAAFYPALASKIDIVTLGADHLLEDYNISHNGSASTGPALFVGQRLGYKNFFNLLHAMTTPCWPVAVKLAVVGGKWLDGEEQLIARLGLSHRIHHLGTVSDEQLRAVYRSSRCLIFPSFQEGFGLPCLEAQANNCPLVCSDIPVFREVAGDAALYFDPRLGESIAEQVARLNDGKLRQQLLEQGQANVRKFRWQDTASKMLEVYRRAKA
jgi:glycosyltransferase involved in cell wall biosynthesis